MNIISHDKIRSVYCCYSCNCWPMLSRARRIEAGNQARIFLGPDTDSDLGPLIAVSIHAEIRQREYRAAHR